MELDEFFQILMNVLKLISRRLIFWVFHKALKRGLGLLISFSKLCIFDDLLISVNTVVHISFPDEVIHFVKVLG